MSREELFSKSVEYMDKYFQSERAENLEGTDETELFDTMINTIEEKFQNFKENGSNWKFERVNHLDIQITQFIPLRGTSWIPLPKQLSNKKAIINMKNEDNECFKWCVTRAFFPAKKNLERIDKNLRENSKRINWTGLKFPLNLKDIKHFEKLNQNISINVLGYKKDVYPLRIYEGEERQHQINLLLIEKEGKKHYCLIKT